MIENTYKIIEKSDIHARPASVLVKTASEISDDVSLEYKGKSVNMQSIMGICLLLNQRVQKLKCFLKQGIHDVIHGSYRFLYYRYPNF